MSKKTRNLIFIIPIALVAMVIAFSPQAIQIGAKSIYTHLGLDLVGGVQVLLKPISPKM